MAITKITAAALFAVFTIACSSSKKSSSLVTPESKSASADNPTLKKANYQRLDNNTFLLEGISTDKTYGYSPQNAIKVGMANGGNGGPANERSYLNGLLGPNGETVTYHRIGSCCPVESKNGMMGMAMLDKYEVTWSGADKPAILYINMYDPGKLMAPVGFTYRKESKAGMSHIGTGKEVLSGK